MYTERNYVAELRKQVASFLAELDKELVKQGRRPNRESEKRTRKLLSGFTKAVYRPYKNASLADLKHSSKTQTEQV